MTVHDGQTQGFLAGLGISLFLSENKRQSLKLTFRLYPKKVDGSPSSPINCISFLTDRGLLVVLNLAFIQLSRLPITAQLQSILVASQFLWIFSNPNSPFWGDFWRSSQCIISQHMEFEMVFPYDGHTHSSSRFHSETHVLSVSRGGQEGTRPGKWWGSLVQRVEKKKERLLILLSNKDHGSQTILYAGTGKKNQCIISYALGLCFPFAILSVR